MCKGRCQDGGSRCEDESQHCEERRRSPQKNTESGDENKRRIDKTTEGDHLVTAGRHPGLDERLNISETYLAIRYGEIHLSRASMIDLMVYVKSSVATGITSSSH